MTTLKFTKEELLVMKKIVIERIKKLENERENQRKIQNIIKKDLDETWNSLYKINRICLEMEREGVQS